MRLEENFERLTLQMEDLGRLGDSEFQILQYEYSELKRGFNTNNWSARLKLNSKIIKFYSDAKVSQEQLPGSPASLNTLGREALTDSPTRFSSSSLTSDISDKGRSASVETLINELAMDKPKRFSHEDLSSFTSNFSTKIGSGAFGQVYKGEFPNGVKVAVKVLLQNKIVEETFMAEVGTMGKTCHRNVVRLNGFCFDEKMKALVYEYMENGSLDMILYKKKISVDWETLYGIAVATARGLSYLHEGCIVKIIHHDVKPANVLLDSNYSPKVTDFGLANLIDENKTHITMSEMRGTRGYVAPEMLIPYAQVTQKCDVYSFGMLLFDILRTRSTDQQRHGWFPNQVWEMFEMGKLDQFIQDCSLEKKDRENAKTLALVALLCARWTATKRPLMSTVVKMLENEISVPVPQNPFIASA